MVYSRPHCWLQVCECLQAYSGLLGGVAYRSPGELAREMEDKAHSLNMAALANRRATMQLCNQLSAGKWGKLSLKVGCKN